MWCVPDLRPQLALELEPHPLIGVLLIPLKRCGSHKLEEGTRFFRWYFSFHSGGLVLCHSVACSYACAVRRATDSSNGCATI